MSTTELRGHRLRELAHRPPAPSPRERPLGTLGLLLTMWQNPLATWTRAHFEQPVVVGKSVLGKIAVVSDAAAIRHILVDNWANYHKGPLQRRILRPGLGNGLLTAEDEDWRAQRRALAPLFTPRLVEAFAPAMGEAARSLLTRWLRRRPGRTLDITGEMSRVTLDVLERTIFPEGLGREPGEFMRAIALYSETLGRIDPLDILGFPDWVPRLGRRNARPALDFFVEVVNRMIALRRQSLAQPFGENDQVGPDLLTLLVRASDPITGKGLTEAEVRANIVTFLAAGHETTANTLTWALFLLATHPKWRQAAEAEAEVALPDGALSGAPLSAALLKALPLTRAIVDESLRLYPPAASLTREALKSDNAAGIRIDKGTIVIVSPWVIHRHQLLWDDPGSFNPARFLPDAKSTIDRFSYLPFGAGPRVCIGASFALQEAVIVLASIIREFRLALAPDAKIIPVQRLTLRPKYGMPMILRRRNNRPATRP
jgi:cytochrome P450